MCGHNPWHGAAVPSSEKQTTIFTSSTNYMVFLYANIRVDHIMHGHVVESSSHIATIQLNSSPTSLHFRFGVKSATEWQLH